MPDRAATVKTKPTCANGLSVVRLAILSRGASRSVNRLYGNNSPGHRRTSHDSPANEERIGQRNAAAEDEPGRRGRQPEPPARARLDEQSDEREQPEQVPGKQVLRKQGKPANEPDTAPEGRLTV